MLTLSEELFLLAIHEENGSLVASTFRRLPYALSGALLVELALAGKIRVEENHRVSVVSTDPGGDDLLEDYLAKIQAAEHPRKLTYWIHTLIRKPKKLRASLAKHLAKQGLLSLEEDRLSLVAPTVEHPDQPASAKYWLKSRLRETVLACSDTDLHDLALLSLLRASGLLNLVFTRDELKTARRRIYEFRVGKALSDPNAQVIEEVEEAVAAQVGDE